MNTDVAAIDDEIDLLPAADLAALEAAFVRRSQPTSNPADDQATRLRSLMSADPAPRPQSPRLPSDTRAPARNPARCARIVAIASGKGGVGKTNVAVNLAIALASRNLRVTLLDADLGTANADVLCGIMPAARLDHVIAPGGLPWADGARRAMRDIAIAAPGGFTLVPGSVGLARMADLSRAEQRDLLGGLAELERDADIIIVDTAAGVGRSVTGFLEAADLSLVVSTPEPTAIADAYALIKCVVMNRSEHWGGAAIASPSTSSLAVVLNQVTGPDEARAVHARLRAVCARFLGLDLPTLGWIAQDLRVPEAVRSRVPLLLRTPQTPASLNLRALAGSVLQHLAVQAPAAPPAQGSNAPSRLSGGLARLLRISGR